jgi:hypothetical protein
MNHFDIVKEIHAAQPPARTVDGALAFMLRVIARLQRDFPAERVGLLIKTAGENIVPFGHTSVSASRLVYPDHNLLVKILSDVPTTNGASWQADEGIPNAGHHGGYLAVNGDASTRPPGPTPHAPGTDAAAVPAVAPQQLAMLEGRLAAVEAKAAALATLFEEIVKQIGAHNEQFAALDAAVRKPLPEYEGRNRAGTVISRPR